MKRANMLTTKWNTNGFSEVFDFSAAAWSPLFIGQNKHVITNQQTDLVPRLFLFHFGILSQSPFPLKLDARLVFTRANLEKSRCSKTLGIVTRGYKFQHVNLILFFYI